MLKRMKHMALAILMVLGSAHLLQADLTKEQVREVNAYRLTKPKIAQFSQATKNLAMAAQKNPKLFDAPPGVKKTQNSMEDLVTVTNSIPDAKKAIEDAGMTAKEYWSFQLAMVYAGTGHMVLKSGGKLPEDFSKENVEFFGANEAEFMKLDKDIKMLQELTKNITSSKDEEEMEEEQSEEEQ